LNAIVNLGLIDRTLANLGAELRRAKATVAVGESRLAEARERRDGLAWTEQADLGLRTAEQKRTVWEETHLKRLRLAEIVEGVVRAGEGALRLARGLKQGVAALSLARGAMEVGNRVARLRELVEGITKLDQSITKANTSLATVRGELAKGLKGKCPVCKQPLPKNFPLST